MTAADVIYEDSSVELVFLQVLFYDNTAFVVQAMLLDTSRRANGKSHTSLLNKCPIAFKAIDCCALCC